MRRLPVNALTAAALATAVLTVASARAEQGEVAEAACRGDVDELDRLLAAQPGRVNETRPGNWITPLMEAAKHDRIEVFSVVMRYNPDVHLKAGGGYTALTYAARGADIRIIEGLLDAGAKVDPTTSGNYSPLCMAAITGRADTVRLLVGKGADVRHKGPSHRTPLAEAVLRGHIACMGALVPALDQPDAFQAALDGDVDRLRALGDAARGARTDDGLTPLHVAAAAGREEAVAFLMGAGGDRQAAVGEMTPLHIAAAAGHAAVVKVLADGGAELELRDSSGSTALHLAARSGSADCVRSLLSAGANVNVVSWEGSTPLHAACERNNVPAIRALLKGGALTRVRDLNAATPADLAIPGTREIIRGWEDLHPEAAKALGLEALTAASRLRSIRLLTGDGFALILIPIGKVDLDLLRELQPQLATILGIKVLIETLEVGLPPPEQASRERDGKRQWDALRLIDALTRYVGFRGHRNVGCLGITGEDIYSGRWNFLFGQTTDHIAVMSYNRFTSEDRSVLLKRARNQALSSTGLMYDIKRCKDPLCPRAYPNSLDEHDAKREDLCTECAAGFEKLFGVKGGSIATDAEDGHAEELDVF